MHAVGDVERIGDVAEQLMFYARERFDQNIPFSETAVQELNRVFDVAEEILARGVVAPVSYTHLPGLNSDSLFTCHDRNHSKPG